MNETTQLIDLAASAAFGVQPEQLHSTTLKRGITLPRQVCMTIMHKVYRHPLWRVKAAYGLRNHATLIHGRRTVQGMYLSRREFRQQLNAMLVSLDVDLTEALEAMDLKGGKQ